MDWHEGDQDGSGESSPESQLAELAKELWEQCRKISGVGIQVQATGNEVLRDLQREVEKMHCDQMRRIGSRCPHLDLEVRRIISRSDRASSRSARLGLAGLSFVILDILVIMTLVQSQRGLDLGQE